MQLVASVISRPVFVPIRTFSVPFCKNVAAATPATKLDVLGVVKITPLFPEILYCDVFINPLVVKSPVVVNVALLFSKVPLVFNFNKASVVPV
jgi:hypothetical protein